MKRRDRRENCFCVDTTQGAQHYFSVQSKTELQQFEMAFYNCTYKAINTIQVIRTLKIELNLIFRQELLPVVMMDDLPVLYWILAKGSVYTIFLQK